jgi:DNA invertase Pin-like site-specific DNA recombinase
MFLLVFVFAIPLTRSVFFSRIPSPVRRVLMDDFSEGSAEACLEAAARSDPGARVVGYARVSTQDQNLDLQLDALGAAGCTRIYTDLGISGTRCSRPGLAEALGSLQAGDKLVVWRLDRLGRSLVHLLDIVGELQASGVAFESLKERIDTVSSGGRLMFHIMAALAEFERNLISERTRAGLSAAKDRGKRLGRPRALSEAECQQANERYLGGEPLEEIARSFSCSRATLLRWLSGGGPAKGGA